MDSRIKKLLTPKCFNQSDSSTSSEDEVKNMAMPDDVKGTEQKRTSVLTDDHESSFLQNSKEDKTSYEVYLKQYINWCLIRNLNLNSGARQALLRQYPLVSPPIGRISYQKHD